MAPVPSRLRRRSPAATSPSDRSPTIDERIAAQRAIEQVYWNHRIWPKDNPGPKPPLAEVMPDDAIRALVMDDLAKSNALGAIWNRPITAEQLQAELDRMATHTRDAGTLIELFAALDDDPVLIGEMLARPALSDRLLRGWYADDARFHGDLKKRAEAALATCGNPGCLASLGGEFHETVWARNDPSDRSSRRLDERTIHLDSGEWRDQLASLERQVGGTPDALSLGKIGGLEETPEAFAVTAVISQSSREVTTATVVWKKTSFDSWWAGTRGGLQAPVSTAPSTLTVPSPDLSGCTGDTWAPTSTGANDPTPRHYHGAIWTGSEMIVWGGRDATTYFNTGGRYKPATDTWTATSTGANVPEPRQRPAVVWTGTVMVVFGGYNDANGFQKSGGRYNPATNIWTPTSQPASLPVRSRHTAVWTGTEMIVWGGDFLDNGYVLLNSGNRYNPVTDIWTATSTGANVPAPRVEHTAVWTGSQMIVWGGDANAPPEFNTGGRYNPATDTWQPTSTGTNVPEGRYALTSVWTGTQMVVWGGFGNVDYAQTGGRYNPSTNAWLPTSIGANVPDARFYTASVWTGAEMIVWGGYGDRGYFDTGGRYDPAANSWTATSTGVNLPEARFYHTAVWTGTQMIIWSGLSGDGYINTGARYCACPSPVTGFRDADGDGYGDPANAVTICSGPLPAGYVTNQDDCNDAAAAVHPGASETCNGLDDDCDGTVDNGGNAQCNDGNPCTDDVCNGVAGCGVIDNTAPCNDGNACTTNDTCGGGICHAGAPLACNDGNGCTDDACNPASGCVSTNNTAPCDDGSACTTGDACGGGACHGGAALICNDGNGCTDDSCNPASGCVSTNNTAPCDDGNACTTGDACGGGACQAGTPVPSPDEVAGLAVDGPASTTLTWIGLQGSVIYDVVSSTIADLQAQGTATAACLANDVSSAGTVDGRADPAEGDGYYYLVRAQSACGAGTYGSDSAGTPRSPTAACP